MAYHLALLVNDTGIYTTLPNHSAFSDLYPSLLLSFWIYYDFWAGSLGCLGYMCCKRYFCLRRFFLYFSVISLLLPSSLFSSSFWQHYFGADRGYLRLHVVLSVPWLLALSGACTSADLGMNISEKESSELLHAWVDQGFLSSFHVHWFRTSFRCRQLWKHRWVAHHARVY